MQLSLRKCTAGASFFRGLRWEVAEGARGNERVRNVTLFNLRWRICQTAVIPLYVNLKAHITSRELKSSLFIFFAEGFSSAGERFMEGVKVRMRSSTVSSVCV